MALQPVVKGDSRQIYDEELHRRFIAWADHTDKPDKVIAAKMGRSSAAISQYRHRKFAGNLAEFEKDVANLLRREEDLEFSAQAGPFCNTDSAKLMWEVLTYCDRYHRMGAVLAASGIGKTEAAKEYKRQNRATVFITASITNKSVGAVMRLLAKHTGGQGRNTSIDQMLEAVIDRLKHSDRLIIFDEAHFLVWESFELLRKVHDCAKVGICYLGQERAYSQMRGDNSKAYLFDQIYSRINMKRDRFSVLKKDLKAIAKSRCRDLDDECIDFLFSRAKGRGHYRYALDGILHLAMSRRDELGVPITATSLVECEQFLMGQK